MAVLAQEVTTVLCVADSSSSLSGKYFTISGMGSDFEQNDYHVWIDVGSASTEPSGLSSTGVEVNISADASAATVATAVNSALDALADFGSSRDTATLTVTNAVRGSVTDAANVDAGLLFQQLLMVRVQRIVIISIQKMIWLGLFKMII